MTRAELTAALEAAKAEIREALETVYNALNSGQQKKIVKDERVRRLFDRHGVNYEQTD